MTLNEYQSRVQRTFQGKNACLENALLGIAGEAGEIVDYVKKVKYQGHPYDPKVMLDEMGDLLFYIANLARICGYTLQEIAEHNEQKLHARYPDGFEESRSIHRQKKETVGLSTND